MNWGISLHEAARIIQQIIFCTLPIRETLCRFLYHQCSYHLKNFYQENIYISKLQKSSALPKTHAKQRISEKYIFFVSVFVCSGAFINLSFIGNREWFFFLLITLFCLSAYNLISRGWSLSNTGWCKIPNWIINPSPNHHKRFYSPRGFYEGI